MSDIGHGNRAAHSLGPLILAAALCALAACGGSSSDGSSDVLLPDDPGHPRAYTEEALNLLDGAAVLRPAHLAILTLEPTQGAGDTGRRDGVDEVTYQLDADIDVELTLDATAHRVGTLVVRDARGRERARLAGGTTRVSLPAGRVTLEVQHVEAGNPAAATQVVFVRFGAAPGATLTASANCPNCTFDNASLTGQAFDGLDLSGSSFQAADVEQTSFIGTNLNDTTWEQALLRDNTFTNAALQRAVLGSGGPLPTNIFSCDFRGADLSGAYFNQAALNDVTFGDTDPSRAANLTNTSWQTLIDPCFFTQVSLVDFRNVDLSGARFSGTQIMGSDFSGASLTGASFTGGPGVCAQVDNLPVITVFDPNCTFGTEPTSGRKTDFSNAILASTTAPSVELQGQKLTGVILAGAQLTGGAFDGYDFSDSDLTNAQLEGAQLNGATLAGTTLTGAVLSNAQLNDTTLDGHDLRGLMMNGAQLNGASLYEANLQGAVLDDAQLVGARLNLANLKDASLRGALAGVQPGSNAQVTQLGGAYMVNVDLTDADLRSADLSNAHLYGTSQLVRTLLDAADLSGAICAGTTFSGSLTDTVFNQAVLVNATFNGADLTGAKLDSAYLQGTDFSAASRVFGATLRNAEVATASGSWTFTEQDGTPFTFAYGATALGAFATDTSVTCPNNDGGPCTPGTLTPVDHGPFPPVPPCVPTYEYCFENCLDPPNFSQRPPCG